MDRRWLVTGIALIVLVGFFFIGRANMPALTEVTPASGETQADANQPLTLTFSENMDADSVTGNLELEPPVQGRFTWDGNTLIFTPDESWPRGESITVTLQAGARSTLGLPILRDQIWSFRASPPLLVYLWPADGPANLYAIDFVEGHTAQLTETTQGVLSYAISADGKEIYYSTRLDAENSAIFRLQRKNRQAQEILYCTNMLCSFPEISPTGEYLAFTRSPSNPNSEVFPQQVWLLPFSGGEPAAENRAFLVSDPHHEVGTPFWSPTGLLTFHDQVRQAFEVYDPRSEESVYFPNETGERGTWAPDGRSYIVHEIDFWGSGPLDYASHLWRFDYPSAQSVQLTSDLALEDVTPSFAPDGQKVAFGRKYLDSERWIPGSQLWLLNADGSNPKQLTNARDFNHADFAWHPNGEYLAFVRHKQTTLIEPPEIWIILPDGSDAVRLVIGGYVPQWIP